MPCTACGEVLWFCRSKDKRVVPINPHLEEGVTAGNTVVIMDAKGNGFIVIPLTAISDEYREYVAPHARMPHFEVSKRCRDYFYRRRHPDTGEELPPIREPEEREYRHDEDERAARIAENPDALRDRDRPGK